MKKLIIFPDIHGRSFWKEPFENHNDDPDYGFIFLGDYVDPYDFEGITSGDALYNFNEICNATFNHERTIRLIGNHDLHYFPEFRQEWGCRRDNQNFDQISKMFISNLDKFQFAHEELINDKRYIFTHAGIRNGWTKEISHWTNTLKTNEKKQYDKQLSSEELWDVELINSFLDNKFTRNFAWIISRMRGGYSWDGSFLWADIYEHLNSLTWDIDDIYKAKNIYQIFGHTLSYPGGEYDGYEINECFAMLDARQPFVLDLETGQIEEYGNDGRDT